MRKLLLLSLWLPFVPVTSEESRAGEWKRIAKTGRAWGGATVYSPSRKQVLRWGGAGGNDVQALDLASGKWIPDYTGEEAHLGGGLYSPGAAKWSEVGNRPYAFNIFRQACWDSKRNRMIIVAWNLTAAYDPTKKTWHDLKAAFDDGKKPQPGFIDKYDLFFAPVPGTWGSCAYDPANDEVLLFPLWTQLNRSKKSYGRYRPELPDYGPEQIDDAGVLAGHYGTFIFDCKTNTWRLPELGGKEMLDARARLAVLVNGQREATRKSWKALIALRREEKSEASTLMKDAAEAQRQLNEKLRKEKAELGKLAGELKGYEAEQVRDALKNLAPVLARAETAGKGLSAGKPEELPALCSLQRATYRELRLVRKHDLYVQPIPRCETSVIYDSRNKVIVMAGGNHLDRLLTDTWVYDCKVRRWRRREPAPEAAAWPGMCFDSKRGLTLYSAEKGTYAYDAAKDQWSKVGAGRPASLYCDMVYDPVADLYLLNAAVGKNDPAEATWAMKPSGPGAALVTQPAPREKVDDAPFPPPADPAMLARIKSTPANTWVAAKPNFEATPRSWSTMCWDPWLRCVVYQGGGHRGTMDNTTSAYFPEANKWVNAFGSHRPTQIQSNASSIPGNLSFERGVEGSDHDRWYESLGGILIGTARSGFDWATREKHVFVNVPPSPFPFTMGFVVHPNRPEVIRISGTGNYAGAGDSVQVFNLETGKSQTHKTIGPRPVIGHEWSGLTVHPDRDVLVLHGAGDHEKKANTETWVLDLKAPTAWRKLELKSTTPPVGMGKLNAVPGTDYCVLAMPGSTDLWVLNLEKNAWKPLPVANPEDFLWRGNRRFDLYGQCVWDPHHKIFITKMMGSGHTLLLKPDFSRIKWD